MFFENEQSVVLTSPNDIRVALIAIYSDKFAMIGESHGISVLSGELINKKKVSPKNLLVLDMYAYNQDNKKEKIFDEVIAFKPHMIGFSCPYGSFDYLKNLYKEKLFTELNPKPLVVFGGALPTYIPEKYLLEVDDSAIVVRGEGEEAICDLVNGLIKSIDFSKIYNISYIKVGEIIHNKRKQVDLNKVTPPYRGHLSSLIKTNAQIFVENSRGCAWGKCNFCSRNMYLDENKKKEYRKFPLERLKMDLITLAGYGINTITFADEDFCGNGLDEMREIITIFRQLHDDGKNFIFDVSMNVNSIYNHKWNCSQKEISIKLFSELKVLGLRKIFLGVESGSVGQLKRYNKQHQPEEAIEAISILRILNIQIEIGYILFDPLCTLTEVEENINYLLENNLAEITSSLGSNLELRLHFATRYIALLDYHCNQTGNKLYTNDFNIDTLNYSNFYANSNISEICLFIREANRTIRPLYYPLKSLSRYGEEGALAEYSKKIKYIVVNIRKCYMQHIKDFVTCFIETKSDISTCNILMDLENSIIELYNQNKKLLNEIAIKTKNNVLVNMISEYSDFIISKRRI